MYAWFFRQQLEIIPLPDYSILQLILTFICGAINVEFFSETQKRVVLNPEVLERNCWLFQTGKPETNALWASWFNQSRINSIQTSFVNFLYNGGGRCTAEMFLLQSSCGTLQYLRPLRMLICRLPLITVQPLRDWAASTESMTFSSHTLSHRPSQAEQDILEIDRER